MRTAEAVAADTRRAGAAWVVIGQIRPGVGATGRLAGFADLRVWVMLVGRIGLFIDHAAARPGTANEPVVTARARRTAFTVAAVPIAMRSAHLRIVFRPGRVAHAARTDLTRIVRVVFAVGVSSVPERADDPASRHTDAITASTGVIEIVIATGARTALFAQFVRAIREDGPGGSIAIRIAELTGRGFRIADAVSVFLAIDHAARGTEEVDADLERFAAVTVTTNLVRTALVVRQGFPSALALNANSARVPTRIVVGGLARLPVVDNPQPVGPGFQRWRAESAGIARFGCEIVTGNAVDQAGLRRAQAEFAGR